VKYKTFWGDKMSFYLPEGNAIYYYGFFEANLTNFLLNYIKEGDIVFDVGAHVGYYTLLNSELVGKKGSVYSFEPTPRTFETLKNNVKNKSNVVINNNAVLDYQTEIEFIDYGPKFSAFNSFRKRESKGMSFLTEPQKVKVKTISLDEYSRVENIKPTFIKIDAEGAEHLILKAMTYILKELRPIISIEVAGEEEWKDNCSQSMKTLREYFYAPFEISLEGYLTPHEQKEKYLYDNIIFIPREKIQVMEKLIKR
jgi:FkbM family methyltransferase